MAYSAPLKLDIDEWRPCLECQKTFPVRYSLKARHSTSVVYGVIAPKWSKYCSKKCTLAHRNRVDNPARRPQARRKIAQAARRRGTAHFHTPEARRKQRLAISGKGHWNWQGGLTHPSCVDCGTRITFRKKRCKLCQGKHIRGENAPNWKGGLVSINRRLRNRTETRQWRTAVFQRDNYTCKSCGAHTKKGLGKRVVLQAHHIKSWANFPELRHELSNGVTLCLPCHRKTDNYGGRVSTELT